VKSLGQHIRSLEAQLQLNAWIKGFLCSLLVTIFLLLLEINKTFISGLGGVLVVAISVYFGAFRSRKKEAIQLLHEKAGNLEFSLELLEKANPTIIEKMQLERISKQIPPKIRIWNRGLLPFILGALGMLVVQVGLDFLRNSPKIDTMAESAEVKVPVALASDKDISLSSLKVIIESPTYTQISPQYLSNLDIQAIKGSKLTWELELENSQGMDLFLVNSSGEKLPFVQSEQKYSLKEELRNSGVYSIQGFKSDAQVFSTDFHTLEAIIDQAPMINPEEKDNYRFFFPGNNPRIALKAQISDDFQVVEVYLVATLARGKGENVKFRETKFPIENRPFNSKNSIFTLDVSQLDFQPGDELYYYWVALDNQFPEPNLSRTDTYFLKYFGENDDSELAMEGMAIQVLPEYFRSQRQIIIDTEKLIAEKGKKPEKVFNFTSNEIGYDQKLLRLRYGQYLGEEFESDAGGGQIDEDGDLLTGYMHLHDQEGEHEVGGIPVGPPQTGENQNPENEGQKSEGIESLLLEYMHAHDDGELNTYYEESTRGALKSALDQMWQAELYLRLFEPEKSLPFQYKALEMLKTVQQKSRVYIKRTGYDPPPIKEEEKRLTGQLEDLENLIQKELLKIDQQIQPLASEVLGLLNKASLNAEEREVIQELGNLWSERLKNSNLGDWNLLVVLQQLESGKLDGSGKNYLREKLYPLAQNYKIPSSGYLSNQALKTAFRKNLK